MSWLTFVLLALVLIFAVQGFRKGMLRMAISMVFFLMKQPDPGTWRCILRYVKCKLQLKAS